MERSPTKLQNRRSGILPFLLVLVLFTAALTGHFNIDFSILDRQASYDPDELEYDGPFAPEFATG